MDNAVLAAERSQVALPVGNKHCPGSGPLGHVQGEKLLDFWGQGGEPMGLVQERSPVAPQGDLGGAA